MNTPFIKKFKVDDSFYIYDVNSNAFFKVDEPVFTLVDQHPQQDRKGDPGKYPGPAVEKAKKNLDSMRQKGYFSSHRPHITFFHTLSKKEFSGYLKDVFANRLNRIILVVSEDCNMRCRYCSYSGQYLYHRRHSKRNMSSRMMKKAVDFYFSHSAAVDEKRISFYGGEPLLNFPLIKECVAYARNNYSPATMFNMTINGTLLNKERIEFLAENRFSLLISLDGPESIHNRNRVFKNGKGTFACVLKNLAAFKSMYPDYYRKYIRFNVVFSPPLDLEAINDFISDDQIKPANISFSNVNTQFTTFFRQFTPEQVNAAYESLQQLRGSFNQKLMDNRDPGEIEKKLYGKKFVTIHRRAMTKLPSKVPSDGQCIIGMRSLLVNIDGSFNFCTQVSDSYNMGNVETGFDRKRIEKFYFDMDELFAGKCYGCWAIRFCMKCVKEFNRDGQLDEKLLEQFCVKKRAAILSEIKDYIRIREANYHALDYLAEIDISS